MRRMTLGAICGVMLGGLIAAGILPTWALNPVMQAQTENESVATTHIGSQFPRRFACTIGSIRGRFAVRTEGAITGVGLFTSVGVLTFDGVGGLTNAATTSTNGNIVSGVTTGTYDISPDDCTGQISFPSISGPALTFNFAIADRGNEIILIATRAPAIISGVGKRID